MRYSVYRKFGVSCSISMFTIMINLKKFATAIQGNDSSSQALVFTSSFPEYVDNGQ